MLNYCCWVFGLEGWGGLCGLVLFWCYLVVVSVFRLVLIWVSCVLVIWLGVKFWICLSVMLWVMLICGLVVKFGRFFLRMVLVVGLLSRVLMMVVLVE